MINSITSVCWDITSKCNDACKFCFRDNCSIDLPLNDNMLILNKFIEYGIKKITFTGGEARLYPDLWELVKYAHEHGIYTNLVTNAMMQTSDDLIDNIEKHLDSITMSLDGTDSLVQKEMTRNDSHFNNVIALLNKIDETGINVKKKVNTLVSKINIHFVPSILPILYKYKINTWKLFQFIAPRYAAKSNETLFCISDSDFNQLKDNLISQNKDNRLKLLFQSKKELETSYFVVSSNGNVRYDGNGKSRIIGNILNDDINHILSRIEFNYDDYKKRR